MTSKVTEVKNYFETTSDYLEENPIGIQARSEIIKGFLSGQKFRNLLDVPCGNGQIAISLADQAEKITMVDIAANMIKLAKNNTPYGVSQRCTFHTGNIFDINLQKHSFDCILAIGILGHVDSPNDFIEHISNLIEPGGFLVLQNTDDSHFKTKIQKFLRGQKRLIQNNSYELNAITHKWLLDKLTKTGYTLKFMYRYETRLPLFIKANESSNKHLNNIWKYFGTPPNNKNGFMGSKCIYLLQKD